MFFVFSTWVFLLDILLGIQVDSFLWGIQICRRTFRGVNSERFSSQNWKTMVTTLTPNVRKNFPCGKSPWDWRLRHIKTSRILLSHFTDPKHSKRALVCDKLRKELLRCLHWDHGDHTHARSHPICIRVTFFAPLSLGFTCQEGIRLWEFALRSGGHVTSDTSCDEEHRLRTRCKNTDKKCARHTCPQEVEFFRMGRPGTTNYAPHLFLLPLFVFSHVSYQYIKHLSGC